MYNAPKWTGEHESLLREMWTKGALTEEIGRKLGRSAGAIQGRAVLLGLPKRGQDGSPATKDPSRMPLFAQYEDDPRAVAEFDLWPALQRGDMTAVLMGDPAPGRSAA